MRGKGLSGNRKGEVCAEVRRKGINGGTGDF